MHFKKATRQLVETSRKVFVSCSLPNGAIVAARPDLPDYPATVQSYGLIWIRDAVFTCVAADIVHLHDLPEAFFRWVAERAERTQSGLLANAYFSNGATAGVLVNGVSVKRQREFSQTMTLVGQVQFDALGTLLWAMAEHQRRVKRVSRTARGLAAEVADGIVRHWNGRSFTIPSWDLWEACVADPGKREVFAYSLAMCIRGLEDADTLLGRSRKRAQATASMRVWLERLYDAKRRIFLRAGGRQLGDATPDASLFGLVFPAQQIAAEDPRMLSTINRILKQCRGPLGGFKRYPSDRYSGQLVHGRLHHTRGGEWPWLSAWATIVFAKQGNRKAAEREFAWILKRSRNRPLPEQYHADKQPSVPALAVSHAFALFAAERLGLL